jgi:small GTP-binding protein
MSDDEWPLKMCVIGTPASLKSQFIQRFADNKFEVNYLPTIGVDITTKRITVNNQKIKLILMDTAGQEQFGDIRRTYIEGSAGALILFYKSERKSFLKVNDFYTEYRSINKSPITVVGILGKLQKKITIEPPYFRLVVAEDVTTEEGRELADKLDLTYVETAIDDRKKVEEILHNLAKKVLDSIKALK